MYTVKFQSCGEIESSHKFEFYGDYANCKLTKKQIESIIYCAGSEGKAFVGNVMLDKATG